MAQHYKTIMIATRSGKGKQNSFVKFSFNVFCVARGIWGIREAHLHLISLRALGRGSNFTSISFDTEQKAETHTKSHLATFSGESESLYSWVKLKMKKFSILVRIMISISALILEKIFSVLSALRFLFAFASEMLFIQSPRSSDGDSTLVWPKDPPEPNEQLNATTDRGSCSVNIMFVSLRKYCTIARLELPLHPPHRWIR